MDIDLKRIFASWAYTLLCCFGKPQAKNFAKKFKNENPDEEFLKFKHFDKGPICMKQEYFQSSSMKRAFSDCVAFHNTLY